MMTLEKKYQSNTAWTDEEEAFLNLQREQQRGKTAKELAGEVHKRWKKELEDSGAPKDWLENMRSSGAIERHFPPLSSFKTTVTQTAPAANNTEHGVFQPEDLEFMTATLQQPGQQQYLAEQEASCHAQILPDSSPVPSSLTQNQQEVPAAEQFLSSQEPPVPQASRLVQQEQNVSQQEVTHPDGGTEDNATVNNAEAPSMKRTRQQAFPFNEPGASGCQPTCVHDQVAHTSTASLKAAWPASAPSSKETNASSAKDSHAFKSAEAPSSKRAKVFTSHRTDTPLTDKATGSPGGASASMSGKEQCGRVNTVILQPSQPAQSLVATTSTGINADAHAGSAR
ncbi:hypothetical protein ABBQ38_001913 [Trebouxia sp. C0009 RCD-2024]